MRRALGRGILMLLVLVLTTTGVNVRADDESDWRELQETPRDLGWVLIRADKLRHIRIFSKIEEGQRLRSMKAEAELEASVEQVTRTLTDFPAFSNWLWNLKSIRVVRQVAPGEWLLYLVFRTPGGLPDRDVMLRYEVQTPGNPRHTLITAQDVPDFPVTDPAVVRIPAMSLTLRVEEAGKNRSRFSSQLQVDPGGRVPVWAANFVQRRAPYATMLGLIRVLEP
ncbi:MAG TPA: START domain-containing protein [Fluviicoccus sp.]|nr:START domain-containing protein [Fluviicoccus sp.]